MTIDVPVQMLGFCLCAFLVRGILSFILSRYSFCSFSTHLATLTVYTSCRSASSLSFSFSSSFVSKRIFCIQCDCQHEYVLRININKCPMNEILRCVRVCICSNSILLLLLLLICISDQFFLFLSIRSSSACSLSFILNHQSVQQQTRSLSVFLSNEKKSRCLIFF